MENEIKVNDFVRLKDGTIAKVIEIKNQDTDILNWYCLDNDMGAMDRSIVKHSPNIIDLIEEGDYVNSGKVIEIDASKDWIDNSSEDTVLREDHVETIVTKEQFESISYKVK